MREAQIRTELRMFRFEYYNLAASKLYTLSTLISTIPRESFRCFSITKYDQIPQ